MSGPTVFQLPPACEMNGVPTGIYDVDDFLAWSRIYEKQYPVIAPVVIAESGGNTCGACFGYFHRNGGSASTLYVPRFAIRASSPEVEKALLVAIGELARQRGVGRCIATYEQARLDEYFCWTKSTVVLSIIADTDAMFANLRGKSRYTIRRAANTFEVGFGREHLDAFYGVYSARMFEKGLVIRTREFFRDLLDGSGECELVVARRQGSLEAGMVWRRRGSHAYYLFNAATPFGLQYNANHLLMWEMMRHYSSLGVELLDLGESSPNGGVYAFKTVQFGGIPTDVRYADILCRAESQRRGAPLPFHLRVATRIQKGLPDSLVRRLELSRQGYGQLM